MRRAKIACRAGNDEQFRHEFRAFGTISKMISLFGAAAAFVLRQALLQLNASHTALPKPLLPQCTATSKCLHFPSSRPLPVFAGSVYYFVACRWLQDFSVFSTFSARFILSRSRNFMRALCNWDLLFPIEQPTIWAISLCS